MREFFYRLDKLWRSQRSARVRALPQVGQIAFRFPCREIFSPFCYRPTVPPSLHLQKGFRIRGTAVSGCSGPFPLVRCRDQPGAYRIQFAIAKRHPEVRGVERAGIKPPLPNVTRGAVRHIPIGRVAPVRLL